MIEKLPWLLLNKLGGGKRRTSKWNRLNNSVSQRCVVNWRKWLCIQSNRKKEPLELVKRLFGNLNGSRKKRRNSWESLAMLWWKNSRTLTLLRVTTLRTTINFPDVLMVNCSCAPWQCKTLTALLVGSMRQFSFWLGTIFWKEERSLSSILISSTHGIRSLMVGFNLRMLSIASWDLFNITIWRIKPVSKLTLCTDVLHALKN